jgi:hypothetical protein
MRSTLRRAVRIRSRLRRARGSPRNPSVFSVLWPCAAGTALASATVLAALAEAPAEAPDAVPPPDPADPLPQEGAPSARDRTVGLYENRLRLLSTPAKVFEYFASCEGPRGERLMTPHDLARSLAPYSFCASARVGSVNPKHSTNLWDRRTPARAERDADAREAVARGIRSAHARGNLASAEARALLRRWRALRVRGTATGGAIAADLERAVRRSGYGPVLDLERLVDAPGNLIGFGEWCLFATLLAVPDEELETAFRLMDEDGNGRIDRSEYERVVRAFQGRMGRAGVAGAGVASAGVGSAAVQRRTSIEQIFYARPESAEGMTADTFCRFVRRMRGLLHVSEFMDYATPTAAPTASASAGGAAAENAARANVDISEAPPAAVDPLAETEAALGMSAGDFGRFLVAHAPARHQATLLARLRARRADGARWQRARVSLADFLRYHEILGALDDLELAMSLVRAHDARRGADAAPLDAPGAAGLDREQMRRASRAALAAARDRRGRRGRAAGGKAGTTVDEGLSEAQLDALFAVFDADADGTIDREELLQCIVCRYHGALAARRDMGVLDAAARLLECAGRAFR